MAATRRKVIVRDLQGSLYRGYLPGSGFGEDGKLELLLPDGHALLLAASDVRHIAYVRDFNMDDGIEPERIGLRSFRSKPRSGGLWVKLQFGPADTLEGTVRADISLLDSLLLDHGLFLELPDRNSNTQRLFVPRSAMTALEILGVAGKVTVPPHRPSASEPERQGDLFAVSTST